MISSVSAIGEMIRDVRIMRYGTWIALSIFSVFIISYTISSSKWLYLGFVLAPLLLYVSIVRPLVFPVGAYFFLIPFDSVLSIAGSASGATLTRVIGIYSILVLLVKGSFERKLKMPESESLYQLLFILFGVLSVIWAINPERTEYKLSTSLGLLILYLVFTAYQFTGRQYEILKHMILAGGVIAASLIIYNFFKGNYWSAYEMRTTMTVLDRKAGINRLCLDLMIPFSISLNMLFYDENKWRKLTFMVISSLIIMGVVYTGSRGGLVSLGAVAVTYAILGRSRMMVWTFISVVLVCLLTFLPDFFVERIAHTNVDKGAGRLDLWVVGWEALKGEFWLAGAGLNNFPEAYTRYADYAPAFRGIGRAAHNIFLNFFVELGIIGISLLILSMIKHYRAIRTSFDRKLDDHILLKAAFWGIIACSLFLDTLWDKSFWLLLTLILVQKNVVRRTHTVSGSVR